ncbi:MAG: hotdog fold domain-containing protein [Gemmatimonadota bacterium]
MSDTGTRLLTLWQRLAPLPGGKWLFSRIVGWIAPYTGSIGARIESLQPGHVVATLRDRRAVRQHLGSVHAVALVNLAEVTSGLATLTAAGPGVRGIVTALQISYHKKARGRLRAESRVTLPEIRQPTDADVTAEITDGAGDVVAVATITWRLAPT